MFGIEFVHQAELIGFIWSIVPSHRYVTVANCHACIVYKKNHFVTHLSILLQHLYNSAFCMVRMPL